ncbi:hypothetical protein CcaverHIS002_0203680 [Cutaneotrichosporon cavernicola]|uniref:Cytochrome b5 heme-binding domain-containing protein n=1 Tax=Cutaneotrichosporon cavernicola TaxID=279322 RepID=A0AA48I0K4_9TREE|nr:uncharacterized protein CcaverHIS019_0203660 [Cutaneotrichosporon cavernicola]BEI81208.1 hypothetical protein CcaverHIS002_0203680 [Cutaneotrichosporon cavernicola]BEI89004.1 hypothetical protein CcaverHIS019_0203660 [Cutaneotrichosporon cavernicola]BEI96780.1 hypothetical protein CcaverHIS631_0203690 [Cutaneotrichosporon cavernicola]BEJ04552.1 hypothetical protein CcaverHIS641_0203690 [Cutaneotrichosporon cavernicola]
MSLSNPLNAALVPAILFVAYRILFPSKPTAPAVPCTRYDQGEYNWAPTKHPKVAVYKDYDVHELTKSDGRGTNNILLAIARIVDGEITERTVFDVSSGANFYGPEGMYGNFAGRDASRGMAKQSFDEDMLTDLDKPLDNLKDLTAAEIDNMHGWHDHFSNKYKVVGRLV